MSSHKSPPSPESLALPAAGVDTHAHLDLDPLAGQVDEVLQRARRAGLIAVGNVFLGPEAYFSGRELFERHPEVFFVLGVHPHDAASFDSGSAGRMAEAFASDTRLKALGEIGLDYYWNHAPHDVQQRAFREQLEMARTLDLPVVIHSRDAEEDVLGILLEAGFKDRPLIWHCFGRDRDLAQRIVSLGWHLSIPGPVSFPKNTALREAVAVIPADRLLLETDCPYLSPVPWRGKTNEPALLAFTAQAVAACRGVDPAELWVRCAANARAVFGLA